MIGFPPAYATPLPGSFIFAPRRRFHRLRFDALKSACQPNKLLLMCSRWPFARLQRFPVSRSPRQGQCSRPLASLIPSVFCLTRSVLRSRLHSFPNKALQCLNPLPDFFRTSSASPFAVATPSGLSSLRINLAAATSRCQLTPAPD
jgi:hypothetical protein